MLSSALAPNAVLLKPVVKLRSALAPWTVLKPARQASSHAARAWVESAKHASASRTSSKPSRQGAGFIDVLDGRVFSFSYAPRIERTAQFGKTNRHAVICVFKEAGKVIENARKQ